MYIYYFTKKKNFSDHGEYRFSWSLFLLFVSWSFRNKNLPIDFSTCSSSHPFNNSLRCFLCLFNDFYNDFVAPWKFWWSKDCYVVNPQKYVFAFEVILSFIFSHFWTGMSCVLCLNGHELCPLRNFSSVEKNPCSSFFLRVGCCLGIFLLQQHVCSFADSSFAQDLRFFFNIRCLSL